MTAPKHSQNEPPQSLPDGRHLLQKPRVSMRFTIRRVGDYLRADLYKRETAEETHRFLRALAEKAREAGVDRVLISVHSSRPIFRVEDFGLSKLFDAAASRPQHRIAAVADSYEGQLAQQYVVVLASLRGLNVRSFSSEEEAIAWLQS